jgi:hypothetical protein
MQSAPLGSPSIVAAYLGRAIRRCHVLTATEGVVVSTSAASGSRLAVDPAGDMPNTYATGLHFDRHRFL